MSDVQVGLALQPLEIKDFSGGITDYPLQGDPKRYERADNLQINIDRQLEVRPGSVGFDDLGNHRMPGQPRRIDGWLTFQNDTILLANQGRDIFYLNPLWTRLLGPSGNEAVSSGDSYSQLAWAEWNNHIYFTSDSGSLPGKLYKDEDGVFQVRTVGLPRPKSVPRYTESSLLAACLLLANDLRASMIAHFNDASFSGGGQPVDGFLHFVIDKWSLSYFVAQTWNEFSDAEYPGPQPTPTPAGVATDKTSLFALVQALSLAYEHHGLDVFTGTYHFQPTLDTGSGGGSIPPKGPFQRLSNNTLPDKIETAAAQLDQLRQRWNWHRFNVYTHAVENRYDLMNRYPLTAPAVGEVDLVGVPYITPNFSNVINYALKLKQAYNAHVTNGAVDYSPANDEWHFQTENELFYHHVTLPDPDTLEDAILTTFWVWAMYSSLHLNDSGVRAHTNIVMDTIASSASVSNVEVAGNPVTLPVGAWVIYTTAIFNDPNPLNQKAARVVSSGSGTAVLSKTALASQPAQDAQYSISFYHANLVNNVLASSTDHAPTLDEIMADPIPSSAYDAGLIPPSTAAWVEVMFELLTALSAHVENADSHGAGFAIQNITGPRSKPEIASYLYAFTFKDEYTVEAGVDFANISAILFAGPVESDKIYPLFTKLDPDVEAIEGQTIEEISSITISNLPVLANTPVTNYDTTGVLVQIYRTIDTGNTYYLEDEVANGTDTYVDSISDSLDSSGVDRLDTRQTLYTTGGAVENAQPPSARFLHILQNTAYYGYVADGGQFFKNRILQSLPGSPDAAPANFSDDLDDEITGISSARNNLIAFCRKTIYRMQGGFNILGQGTLTHEKISDTLGCVSGNSIVQTEIGVFFAGTDGFYYTDGFQLIKISIDLDISYNYRTQTSEQARRISGTYDRRSRRIYWTMQAEPTAEDCNEVYVYYLNYGVKPSGVYTTHSNGMNFMPSANVFFQNKWIRGDARGLVFKHDSIYLDDPEVPADLSTPLDEWNTVHIPWDYKSCALDFGTIYKGQWVTRIHLLAENAGNVNLQVNSITDNRNASTEGKKPLAPIRYTDNVMWGDPSINWGTDDCIWKYDGKLDAWRRFPAKTLRSQLKQVQFVPARIGVYNYDDYPEFSYASVDTASPDPVVTIAQPAGFSDIVWPGDCLKMSIAFEYDGYENEFEILSVADDELEISDPNDLLIDLSNQKWVIRGYMKQAGFRPLSYVLHFSELGFRGQAYPGRGGRGEVSG